MTAPAEPIVPFGTQVEEFNKTKDWNLHFAGDVHSSVNELLTSGGKEPFEKLLAQRLIGTPNFESIQYTAKDVTSWDSVVLDVTILVNRHQVAPEVRALLNDDY